MKNAMVSVRVNHLTSFEKMDCCCCKTVRMYMNTAYFCMY